MDLLDRTVLRICKVAGVDPDVNLQGKLRFVLQDLLLDTDEEKKTELCRHRWDGTLAGGPLEYCSRCGIVRLSGVVEEPVPDLFFNQWIGGTPAELSDLEGEERRRATAAVVSCARRQFLFPRSRWRLSGSLRDALAALDEIEGGGSEMKSRIFMNRCGYIYLCASGDSDRLSNGCFVSTADGRPSSWLVGHVARVDARAISRQLGIPLGDVPPVIVGPGLLKTANAMVERNLSSSLQRLSKADRLLSERLRELCDLTSRREGER